MLELNVNVDHIATLRQARKAQEPDPVLVALLAELAGAKGITIHLRKDRRHIQERDLDVLRSTVKTKLNLEMGTNEETVKIALKIKPDMATLVPEKEKEVTTEGGLNLSQNTSRLKEVTTLLQERGISVFLFIKPDSHSVRRAHKLNVWGIELHTGIYAEANSPLELATELEKIAGAAVLAKKLGLRVHAGHGLNYQNVRKFCLIKEIEVLSIGYSIIARACIVGIERAVKEMIELIKT